MRIVSQSLSERAFEIVREQILSGRIAALAPIRQDALAEQLGISKIPLREALTRLEQQGLLESSPNRGYFVPALTSIDAEEIFALRLKIEPDAAVEASLQANEAARAEVKTLLASLEKESGSDSMQAVSHHRAFHVHLVRLDGHRITSQLVERLHVLAERYVRKHLEPAGRKVRALTEHRAILDAWLNRDAPRIKALLSAHISSTLDDLRNQLASEAESTESWSKVGEGRNGTRLRKRNKA